MIYFNLFIKIIRVCSDMWLVNDEGTVLLTTHLSQIYTRAHTVRADGLSAVLCLSSALLCRQLGFITNGSFWDQMDCSLSRAYTVRFSSDFEPNSDSWDSSLSRAEFQLCRESFAVQCTGGNEKRLASPDRQSDGRMNFWQAKLRTDCPKRRAFSLTAACAETTI